MKSNSEQTFGARAENAKKLKDILKTIVGYNPGKDGLYIADYEARIDVILAVNSEIAAALHEFSTAVESRQKLFKKDSDALHNILKPVIKAVRLSFGRSSKELADIKRMKNKITGTTTKTSSKDPSAKSISQSERSFGSITQNFSNIIDTVEKYGAKYNPADDNIKLPALKDKLIKIKAATSALTTAYTTLALKRDQRSVLYQKLSEITEEIKDAISLQYGENSPENKLAKGIVV